MRLYDIVFSPTEGTQKAASLLEASLGEEAVRIDLTDGQQDFRGTKLSQEDVAVISVPSYGGRVPAVAVERLTALDAQGARAILLCAYGNRAYEDTLVELEDAAQRAGFRVIAAVAAVAEHSIARQFAAGRPDGQDARQLAGFADKIKEKLSAGDSEGPDIPGNRPYKKAGSVGMVPRNRRSGKSISSVSSSRQGNKRLKNLLIFSCNSLSRSKGRFGDYYRSCRERGMCHGEALKAVARKRLKVIYAIMRDKVPYSA